MISAFTLAHALASLNGRGERITVAGEVYTVLLAIAAALSMFTTMFSLLEMFYEESYLMTDTSNYTLSDRRSSIARKATCIHALPQPR